MSLTADVRNAVSSLDPNLPIYNTMGLDAAIHRGNWFYTVFGTVFIVFGVAALFMASVGLYGVLAFSVSRRVQEMGIRMALGADAGNVLSLILRQGAVQIGVGLSIGMGMAWGVSTVIGFIMFDVDPRDASVFATVFDRQYCCAARVVRLTRRAARLAAGAPLHQVQRHMRHAAIGTTLGYDRAREAKNNPTTGNLPTI